VDCIKGKKTKHSKKEATRRTQFLEIIHTDVCGPFDTYFLVEKSILSPLLMIFHVMVMSICLMKNLKQ